MAHISTFNEEFRLAEIERGRKSLVYFMTTILGLDLIHKKTKKSELTDVHYDLCHFLEGRHPFHPWNFALVCAFRGMGKSVPCTQVYPQWRGIYINGFSTKIVSNSDTNAYTNHFKKILNLWQKSSRSDYLQWLYQERLPKNMEGWNSDQIVFNSDNPQASPSITYWGNNSKFEGWHGDLVIGDDLEGADAAKSFGASQEAWNTYQSFIPLLSEPAVGQILIVGTPHGLTPIVYRIRDENKWWTRGENGEVVEHKWASEADNQHTSFKIFWRELLDERGESRWPAHFPLHYIKSSLMHKEIFNQQYMLRRSSISGSLFDMNAVVRSFYNWDTPGFGVDQTTKLIRYPAFEFDPDKLGEDGYLLPTPVNATVNLGALRYYIHFDPVHKEASARRTSMATQRPSFPSIIVVGVAPDLHSFVVDYWFGKDGKADLAKQVEELFRLYRKWCPHRVTWESIGAQFWLRSYIEMMEQSNPNWRTPMSSGALWKSIPLPRLSRRLQEGEKTNQSKEQIYRVFLSPFVNSGIIHFRKDQVDLVAQLANAQDENQPVDLLDALSQGPEVWTPPVSESLERGLNARSRFVRAMTEMVGWRSRTGYAAPPWSEPKRSPNRPH